MRLEYTDRRNKDFIMLCRALDDYINELVGGEENRAGYIQYNTTEDINEVILAYDGGDAIGCAGFKRYDDECAEVKKVFLTERYRGKGFSKLLIEKLETRAAQKGSRYMILESGEPLAAAMALYGSMGYVVIPDYGKYKDMPVSVCMKKAL